MTILSDSSSHCIVTIFSSCNNAKWQVVLTDIPSPSSFKTQTSERKLCKNLIPHPCPKMFCCGIIQHGATNQLWILFSNFFLDCPPPVPVLISLLIKLHVAQPDSTAFRLITCTLCAFVSITLS